MAQPIIGRLITGGPPTRSKPQRILESHHKVTNAIHKVTDHLPRHGALQTMAAVLARIEERQLEHARQIAELRGALPATSPRRA